MKKNPRISILCPILNVEKYISQTIESILAQSCSEWELIIMDGQSKDGTLEIVNKYAAKDKRIRVYSEPDECSWHAFDKTLELARGEFICNICGQDGFLDKNWLATCLKVFDSDRAVSLVWGLTREMTEEGRILDQKYDISYGHFMESEQKNSGLKLIAWKTAQIIGELVRGKNLRQKKFLLDKLFSRSALLKFNFLIKRSFPNNKVPQKKDWLLYWLNTGTTFPDQSMVVSKRVFLELTPRYVLGNKTIGTLSDFYYNFNVKGYLAWFVPIYAVFGRRHPNQSGERAPLEMHQLDQKYLDKIMGLRKEILKNHKIFTFRDREGEPIASKQF